MSFFSQLFDELLQSIRHGTVSFFGLLCLTVFGLNAALMIWLIVRKGTGAVARCPQCGRSIVCPHCTADREPPAGKTGA